MNTLILEGKTIKTIVGIKETIAVVEKAFRYLGEGKVQMPPKVYIRLDKYKGDFRAMPAYLDGFKGCGIKWVNVHPDNRKKGLPTVMAIIILNDSSNGFPLCVMDATYLTALRTGAAGAVAAKYLANKDSRKVGLVGCGVQAQTQLLALKELFNINQVNIWSLRCAEAIKSIRNIKIFQKIKINVSGSIKDCVKDCDIIVTATPSRKPLVKLGWIKPGTHINAIGADAKGKQELDPSILKKAKIVVDSWEQAKHSGEINVPLSKGQISRKDIYADIGEVVIGKKSRSSKEEITVFDSTGLAIQDIAMANAVYSKAVRLKIGRRVTFI